jgi:hypothetical protein
LCAAKCLVSAWRNSVQTSRRPLLLVSGTESVLYGFSGHDGGNPYAGLIQGSDGNFLGQTEIDLSAFGKG